MGTADKRIDTRLNKEVWKCGVRNIPKRVHVRLSRIRNDDEDAKEFLFTVESFSRLFFQGIKHCHH